jgi:hypothetical protein
MWTDNGAPGGPRYPQPASPPAARLPVADPSYAHGPSRPERADYGYGTRQPPADPLAPGREGKKPPPLQLPGRHGRSGSAFAEHPANTSSQSGGQRRSSPGSHESVSSLLKRLELLGDDQRLFESVLDSVYQASDMTPEERGRSWDVISSSGWYENVCRNNGFRSTDLADIFVVVVIPDLAEQPPAEVMARWALDAPVPMVEGLLAAAKMTGAEMRNTVIEILEPALAYRWTIEHFMKDYWDDRRVARSYAGSERDDGNLGFFGRRRRSGRR